MRQAAGIAHRRVAVVGAGGLGGPICLGLSAADVRLEIFDDDRVDASNLHRQLHFTTSQVGEPKAERLAEALRRHGADALARPLRWTSDLAASEAPWDLIIDGSDDPQTKFAVADWAARHRRPSVIAGALGLGGNVLASAPGAACLRCLFEEPPQAAPTCAQAGVLGPVVAAIAGLAARAAAALLRGDLSEAGVCWILENPRRPPRRLALRPRPGCACGAAAPLQSPDEVA